MSRALAPFTVALLLAVGVAVWSIVDVWPFFADDAFISLRYSDRLLAGDGLTWTDGERVEGYSNLAWVLLCALLGTGMPTAVAARVLGVVCMGAAVALLAWRFRRTPAAGVAALMTATVAFAPWAIGGLELPLLVLCITAGLLAAERAWCAAAPRSAWLRSGCWFAVGALTRPDAPLLPAMLAAVVFVRAWSRRRAEPRAFVPVAWLLAPVAVATSGQLVFRFAYYGDWLANSARVKIGDGTPLVAEGAMHLGGAIAATSALWALAAFGAVGALRSGVARFAIAPALCTVAWASYLVVVGGDFFPGFRLVVPMLPALVVLAGLGLERLAAGGRARCTASAVVIAVAIVVCRVQTMHHADTQVAAQERWEFDGLAIGATLARAFGSARPLVAVDAAGAVPYASRLPSLDMLGLCDATIARDPLRAPANSSFSRAHRRGSPEYLLRRAPDLFLFGPAPGQLMPDDGVGRALVDDPRFVARYRCIWLAFPGSREVGPGPRQAPLWVAVHGACGVQTLAGETGIPALLLGSATMMPGFRPEKPEEPSAVPAWEQALAKWLPWLTRTAMVVEENGAPWLEVRSPGAYGLDGLALTAGDYALVTDPPAARGSFALCDATRTPLPFADGHWTVPAGATDLALVLTCTAADLPLRVRRITCVRRQ